MSDYSLSSISRIETEARAAAAVRVTQSQEASSVDAAVKVTAPERSDKSGQSPQSLLPVTRQSDVCLKFLVNDETKDITVYVVDRSSEEVIRTIPPEELENLNAGDLLKLAA